MSDRSRSFRNFAGNHNCDHQIAEELAIAGIEIHRLPECMRSDHAEMRTIIIGGLHGWSFHRAWRYWIAEGPGIPPDDADQLHASHGQECRVDGHCGCPSPREWFKGFAVGHYHVDTQDGLNALADTIRRIAERSDGRS